LPFLPTDAPSTPALLLVFAVVRAMVPDSDAVESKIKHVKVRGIKPLMRVTVAFNREFGDRGALHSLQGLAIWIMSVLPLY